MHEKKQKGKGPFDDGLLMVMKYAAEDSTRVIDQNRCADMWLPSLNQEPPALYESFSTDPLPKPSQIPFLDLPTLEQRIADTINAQRLAANLPPLTYDTKLASVAQRHSEDMATNGYFSHVNGHGQDPTARALAQGYPVTVWRRAGWVSSHVVENLCLNYANEPFLFLHGRINKLLSEGDLATSTVGEWMDSPAHRENILTPYYERQGIGVAVTTDGKVYITQLLW